MPRRKKAASKQAEAATRKKLKEFKEGTENPAELAKERKEVQEEIKKDEEKAEQESQQEPQAKNKGKSKSESAPESKTESKTETTDQKAVVELERGHIYFLYRPKVQEAEAHKLSDVQRLFILLAPETEKESGTSLQCRLIAIPRKKLPSTRGHGRHFGIVVGVDSDKHNLIDGLLKTEEYETQKEEKVQTGARVAGEGIYSILGFHKHTHLAYVLEVPESIGDVQRELNIQSEGSFVLSVKNPKSSTSKGELDSFPSHLQDKFEGRRWYSCDPPEFLNYKDAEILLVGAAPDIVKEIGALGKELEDERDEEIEQMASRAGDVESQVLKDLGTRRGKTR